MKKGFTLVELLAVVFILGIIVTIVSISSLNTIKEANEKAFLLLVSQIEGAAEDYAINYSDILTKLTPSNTTTLIPLSELQKNNLLENKITDPRNDGEIKSTEQVKIERKTDGSIAYTFLYSDAASYKPSIGLMGASSVYLEQGQAYIEAGAVATDYSGKDISSRISITGTVNTGVAGIYELGYSVTDPLGNTSEIITRTIEVIASQSPTVAFGTNGNATYATMHSTSVAVSDNVAVNPTSLEYQWTTSTTAPTEVSFTTSFTNGGTVNSPAGVTGGYYLWILAKDTAGNTAIVKSNVFNLDNTIPTVAFGTNGSTTYAKTRSTTVTVSDNVSLNTSSLEYQWTTSTTAPTEASFTTTFTNGGTISSPAGVSGGYYLWILGKDTLGNTMIARSNVFNLDNTAPVITMLGSTPVSVQLGNSYTDAGATATDNIDGTITASIVTVNNVNTSVSGTYTVTYNVTDAAGNAATQVTRTVNVSLTVDYLVVAGGGAGGGANISSGSSNTYGFGGGGGGGVKTGSLNLSPGSFAITVGNGGVANTSGSPTIGGTGGASSIASLVSCSGGGGGGAIGAGAAGGSGGGGGSGNGGGAGTSGQGYNGAGSSSVAGGGGGGAGAAGSSGNGATGVYVANFASWGVNGTYGGGGGGGLAGNQGGSTVGGYGGGGAAGHAGDGAAGMANTGGGGGGGGSESTYETRKGGNGGSGIVIVRYAGTVAKGTGGTITITGGYVYHVFTASGTLVLN